MKWLIVGLLLILFLLPSCATPTDNLSNFKNYEELESWLASADVHGENCVLYSLDLQRLALEDGHILSLIIIRPNEYNPLFTKHQLSEGEVHAINSAVTEEAIYYIEPQTKEIAIAAYLSGWVIIVPSGIAY